MTPMDLMLFNAAGNKENLSLPPRTMYSCSPATSTISLVKTLVLMSNSGAFTAAETETPLLEEEVLAAEARDEEDFRNRPYDAFAAQFAIRAFDAKAGIGMTSREFLVERSA